MSWGEIGCINSNMKKTLNEQLREHSFTILKVITETGTYTPEKTGLYRIICVGAGGNGVNNTSTSTYLSIGGGGGGVAIKDMVLSSTTSYNVTVSTTASFGSLLTAEAGLTLVGNYSTTTQSPNGGTASGGDYNFQGEAGRGGNIYRDNLTTIGGSVGVVIGELLSHHNETTRGGALAYGNSIWGYGGGGSAIVFENGNSYTNETTAGLPAAVIIIPLELEA